MRRRDKLTIGSQVSIVDSNGEIEIAEVCGSEEAFPIAELRNAENDYHPTGQFYRIWSVRMLDGSTRYFFEEALKKNRIDDVLRRVRQSCEEALRQGNADLLQRFALGSGAWVCAKQVMTRKDISKIYEVGRLAS